MPFKLGLSCGAILFQMLHTTKPTSLRIDLVALIALLYISTCSGFLRWHTFVGDHHYRVRMKFSLTLPVLPQQ